MKKGDIIQGIVEKVVFPNKGIIRNGDDSVIVKNVIPGQTVKAVITKKRKEKSEGRLLEVLEKAPNERTEGICPHFFQCGGCVYQNLPYSEQLAMKEQQVKELLRSVCPDIDTKWQGIHPSPISEGYRNKMEFSFGDARKDGPLTLGLHRRGSFYDIVTTEHCMIVHPDFGKILLATQEYFSKLHIPFYQKLSHTGYLRHLLVRRAVKTGEILVDLVTTTNTDWLELIDGEKEILEGWKEKICSLSLEGKLAGILHTQNNSLADVVQNDHTDCLYGQNFFYEELLGLRFQITPFSFFQTNSKGAEVLYQIVRSYIGSTNDKVIADLYSGTGTIAQILAPVARKVIGVEIVPEAVESARKNAAANGLNNCEFRIGDVLKEVDEIGDKPDLLVLDPPREGIHPKALPKIAANIGTEKIVYVSCNPVSLVRDIAVFQEYGYQVKQGCSVDMFPGTVHVECVVLMSRVEK